MLITAPNLFLLDKIVASVNSVSNWPYFVPAWFWVAFDGYSHSQTSSHPTYNEPQLLPKLPLENVSLSCDVFNSYLINLFIFCWRNSVVIILQQKILIWIPLNLLEGVYSPPHFIFSTYDQFDLWPGVQNIVCV